MQFLSFTDTHKHFQIETDHSQTGMLVDEVRRSPDNEWLEFQISRVHVAGHRYFCGYEHTETETETDRQSVCACVSV